MTLTILLVVTLALLYLLGIMVGSHIEKQRQKEVKPEQIINKHKNNLSSVSPTRKHVYAEHQRMFDSKGQLVWEHKRLSKLPAEDKVDILA